MSFGLQAPGREADRELPRPPAPRWLWWSIAATGLATLCCLVAVLAIPLEERLPLVGIVEDGDSLLIHAPREGRIARLCVADGQQVTAGEPLLALEDAAWRQEAEQARAALAEAEAALAAALAEQACALPQELLLAASEATALAVVVAERQALWERLRQGGEGAVSAWELAREQLALREAERALTRARAAQALIDGPWGEGQRAAAAARAQLAAARQRAAAARLAHAEAELAACLVRAPRRGRCSLPEPLAAGMRVASGQPLLRLLGDEARRLRLESGDARCQGIAPGSAVRFRLRAVRELARPARAATISAVARERRGLTETLAAQERAPYVIYAVPADGADLPLGALVDAEVVLARRSPLSLLLRPAP